MPFEPLPTAAEGKFVITLCSVATAVTIPQPRSPQLTRFRFFLGQTLEDGRKRYTLYMGYFATPAEAGKWLNVLRGIYPDAFVSEGPATHPGSFSDTQVLSILEERRAHSSATVAYAAPTARNIKLLRPEDTGTRLALKDAVARDAPVSFAVQLQWSSRPMDLELVPRHPIFSSYTLYTTGGLLDGRELFCLRLGFFSDAISAKQVAQFLLSDFPAVAVLPVNPSEHATALKTGKRSVGAAVSAQARPARANIPETLQVPRAPAAPARARRVGVTLEETLESLKTSELAMYDADEAGATGVRHLQIVKERPASRQARTVPPQPRKV